MTRIGLIGEDAGEQAVVATLLSRLGCKVIVLQLPLRLGDRQARAASLQRFAAGLAGSNLDAILALGFARKETPPDVIAVEPDPSLAAWLTRDVAALASVFGEGVEAAPAPARAEKWLDEQASKHRRGRGYSAALDGVALAELIDLGLLAESSAVFRGLASRISPAWSAGKLNARRPGRPPGVALFRSTGYALCLELLARGEGAEVRAHELAEALHRSKTPMNRLVSECVRRGYLHRTTPKGPLTVRGVSRLVNDLVKDIRGRAAIGRFREVGVRSDRKPEVLLATLAKDAGKLGRPFALSGAHAVEDLGGDLLVGAPPRVYTPIERLEPLLRGAAAVVDDRDPQVVLVEPYEEGVFHRQRGGAIPRVAPWQAVLDLTSSDSDREREAGEAVRQRLVRR